MSCSQDVEGQGFAGDVIDVRHGLARNRLIPKKLAVPATRPNIERFGRRVQASSKRLQDFSCPKAAAVLHTETPSPPDHLSCTSDIPGGAQ